MPSTPQQASRAEEPSPGHRRRSSNPEQLRAHIEGDEAAHLVVPWLGTSDLFLHSSAAQAQGQGSGAEGKPAEGPRGAIGAKRNAFTDGFARGRSHGFAFFPGPQGGSAGAFGMQSGALPAALPRGPSAVKADKAMVEHLRQVYSSSDPFQQASWGKAARNIQR